MMEEVVDGEDGVVCLCRLTLILNLDTTAFHCFLAHSDTNPL